MRWWLYDLHVKTRHALTSAVRDQLRRDLVTTARVAGTVLGMLLLLTTLYGVLAGATTGEWLVALRVAPVAVVVTVALTLLHVVGLVLVAVWLNWPQPESESEVDGDKE